MSNVFLIASAAPSAVSALLILEFKMFCVLLFELLSYLNMYYYCMYALIEVLVLVYKWSSFSWYPFGNLALELAIQALAGVIEMVRIFLGSKGVRSHRVVPLLMSILLSAPAILSAVYFLMWQTFITRIEGVLCIVQLAFVIAETLLAVPCIFYTCKDSDF